MPLFYHNNFILSILKFKLNSFVNILFMLYNTIVSKTKKIIIISSVVGGTILILIACLLLVFFFKPDQGEKLQVENISNHIYISAPYAEEKTYNFKFTNGDEIKTFNSVSRQFDITELLWNGELSFGTQYNISYCLVEKSGILAGEYSDSIEYTPTIKLDAPVVNFDDLTCTISWQQVRGAEFYNLYYFDGDQLVSLDVDDTSFDLSLIKGGERQVYVTSNSNQSFFFESENSNIISTTVIHKLLPFINAYIDQFYNIHILSTESVEGVDVFVSDQMYYVDKNDFESIKTNEGYEIIFSAQLFYNDNVQIKVRPSQNIFNVYEDELTLVTKSSI